MTYEKALAEAQRRAARDKRVMFVWYCDWHSSPDYRNRYACSDYLHAGKNIKVQVFPNGEVHNAAGEPVCPECWTVNPEPWEVDPNDPPAWACGQDPCRCEFCGSLLD